MMFWLKWGVWLLRDIRAPPTHRGCMLTHTCSVSLTTTHTLGSAWTLCHRASRTIYENGAGRDGGHANWASLLCSPTYITDKTQVRDKMIKNLKTVTAKHYSKRGRSWAQSPGNCLGHRPRKLVPSIGEKTLWQAISWLRAGRGSTAGRPTWLAWGKPEGQQPAALGHNESQLQSSMERINQLFRLQQEAQILAGRMHGHPSFNRLPGGGKEEASMGHLGATHEESGQATAPPWS